MGRFATGTRLRVVEFVRAPTAVALLFVLPPVVVEMYGIALESFPELPTLSGDPATAGRITGTLFAVAFLAGLVGLFQVISARSADERVAVAGFPRSALLASRLVTMLAVAVAGSGVAFAVFASRVDAAAPVLAFATLVLAGLVYGLLGIVVGTLVPRELEGSVVLVFLADLDNALSSGLFPVDAAVGLPVGGEVRVTDLVPLYHPHELFSAAVLEGEVAAGHLVPALAWALGLLALAFVAYGRSTGGGGVAVPGGWSG